MDDHLIETQAKAAEIVYGRISPYRLKTLGESVENACQLPANVDWSQNTLQFMGRLNGTRRRDGGPASRDCVLSPSTNS